LPGGKQNQRILFHVKRYSPATRNTAKAEKAAEAAKAAKGKSAAKASPHKSPAAGVAATDITAGKEAYHRANYETALQLRRTSAEQNHTTAQFVLDVL
jgi:hypothetical protein